MFLSLGYVIKAPLRTHKGAQKDKGRRGSLNIPCPAGLLPGSSQEPSALQWLTSTSPDTQVQAGTRIKDLEAGTPCVGSSQGCPGRARAPGSRCETCQGELMEKHLSCNGGTHHGIQGKSIWGLHRIYYGLFREGTKDRERDGFNGFR